MADEYLNLHNLEETETPFTVARIIDEELQSSPECQLPADVPLVLNLPSLDVELPDLTCLHPIDVPLYPPPYFCTPSISGSIVFTGADEILINEIEPISIDIDEESECDFKLKGEIEICVPVYQATLIPLTEGCFGPETWAVVWSSTCGVSINTVPQLPSGSISPADPGDYVFAFTCCDGAGGLVVNELTVTVPGAPSGGGLTGGTAEIPVTYDAAASNITIDVAADGCGFILSPEANVSIDCAAFEVTLDPENSNGTPGTTNKVFFNGMEVGTTETYINITEMEQSDCRQQFKTDSKADVTLTKGLVMSTCLLYTSPSPRDS